MPGHPAVHLLGQPRRRAAAQQAAQPAHIRHIAILVYALWGIPSIYYGSEFGIEGKKEWGSDWPLRPCLDLADWPDALESHPIASLYAALGRLKAEEPALTWAKPQELLLTTERYAFARVWEGRAIVAVLNNADAPARLELPLPVPADRAEDLLAGCAGSREVEARVEGGRLLVELPGNWATLLALGGEA